MNRKAGVTHVQQNRTLLVSELILAFGMNGIAEVDAGKLAQETGNSQAVKEFVSVTLPTVQAHLAKIKQMAASAGTSTN